MRFENTSLPGVVRVVPEIHGDARGFFAETWHARRFADGGIAAEFVQDNFSHSCGNTLRGIHYQVRQAQGKLVRVVHGEIFDVAVDLRRSSAQFGRCIGEILSADNQHQLWVPPGFGHGFLVLSEFADVEYKCTDYYAPEFDRAIRWNDPDIGIDWPLRDGVAPILSAKDEAAPFLQDAETYP